jgi:16S rRNA processing protein RimM
VPADPNPGLLLAGEVGKPHGLDGEVYVIVVSDDPHRFEPGSRLHHADGRVLTVTSARRHRDRFLVRFEGIEDRRQAEGARGPLYVPPSEARTLDDDEFWQHDLVGCMVVDGDGTKVGEITSIVTGPAQDLLVVSTSTGDHYIPAVKEIVVAVDLTARRVTVDPPEGLLA